MGRFFDPDNAVWSFFGKFADAFVLSILWTITSIPIFTIGASNAAIYYVLLKVHDEKDVKVVRDYFKAFKENFKIATIIWVPLFMFMIIGAMDIMICINIGGNIGYVGTVLFASAMLILMVFNTYVFPIIGRFENTIRQTVKNGFLMPIKHFGFTLFVVFVIVSVVALGIVFPPIVIFLPGVMAFAISIPMHRVFDLYIPKQVDSIEERAKGISKETTGSNANTGSSGKANLNVKRSNANTGRIKRELRAGKGKSDSKMF